MEKLIHDLKVRIERTRANILISEQRAKSAPTGAEREIHVKKVARYRAKIEAFEETISDINTEMALRRKHPGGVPWGAADNLADFFLSKMDDFNNDERMHLPPADVGVNAPLALIQVALKEAHRQNKLAFDQLMLLNAQYS